MSFDRDVFRIAVIGDFSARAHRAIVEPGRALATRRPIRIDRDNLDDVIARLAPTLMIEPSSGSEPIEVRFASVDDFHPDSLFQRLPVFRALRDAGSRAMAVASSGTDRPAAATPAGVLDAILGDVPAPPGGATVAAPASPASREPDSGLSAFVARAVAPHIVRQPGESELAAQARSNEAIAAAMRALLHHRHFQALEALWRDVALLVRRLDTDTAIQLHLVDVSPAELAGDLASDAVEKSGTYRLLTDREPGYWSLLAAAFPLGDDAPLLERLGAVARETGAPLLADAHSSIAGVADLAVTPDPDDWDDEQSVAWLEVRESSVAPWVALMFPRLLARLPYGRDADPCELFPFEEIVGDAHPAHADLLWGSAAIAGALVVGQEFMDNGWQLKMEGAIDGLPLHVYRADGESFAVPITETIIGERAARRLLERGLSPVLGVRDSASVVIPLIQSIAGTLSAPHASWSSGR